MRDKYFISCLFILFSISNYSVSEGQGTSAFNFLQMNIGSRAQGLGNAFTAVSGDINGIYYNPAISAFAFRPTLMLYHAQWFEDISIENVSFLFPNVNNFAFSIGLSYLHFPDIEGYDINLITGEAIPLESFQVYNFISQLGISYKASRAFSIGIQAKYLIEKIENVSASGFAFDIGLLYKLPVDFLSFGASVQNLGPNIKYEMQKEKLPLTYRLGLAYQIPYSRVLFSVDGVKIIDEDWRIHPGVEVGLIQNFTLRAGYQFQQDIGDGYNFGFGINFMDDYNINYVFAPYGELGSTHRAEFVINFGEFGKQQVSSARRASKSPEVKKLITSSKLPVPSGLKAEQRGDKIILRWNSSFISGSKYNIYVKVSGKKGVVKISKKPLVSTQFSLTPNVAQINLLFYVSVVIDKKESYLSKPILMKYKK